MMLHFPRTLSIFYAITVRSSGPFFFSKKFNRLQL